MIGAEPVSISGKINERSNINVQILDQKYSIVDRNLSILENIRKVSPDTDITQLRSHLAKFIFRGNSDVEKIASVLSGGEIVRLALAMITLKPVDLLVLDEPTNNLDISAIDSIEDVLSNFSGSILAVSHDIEFLDNIGISTCYNIANKKLERINSKLSDRESFNTEIRQK